MTIILTILWILATLLVVSITAIIGKKYGVEYVIAVNATLIVIANVLATKLVTFGNFIVPGGVIVFSMTFVLTDILSEKWGKKYAQKAMWAGFIANFIFIISLYIVLKWNSPVFALEGAKQFANVLQLAPRIVLGAFAAYIIGQNHDIWAFHFWKRKTKGKHLWLRNNASTIVSQLLDTTTFTVIAFGGVLPVIPLIVGSYVVKVTIAVLDTPFIYLCSWIMDKIKNSESLLR